MKDLTHYFLSPTETAAASGRGEENGVAPALSVSKKGASSGSENSEVTVAVAAALERENVAKLKGGEIDKQQLLSKNDASEASLSKKVAKDGGDTSAINGKRKRGRPRKSQANDKPEEVEDALKPERQPKKRGRPSKKQSSTSNDNDIVAEDSEEAPVIVEEKVNESKRRATRLSLRKPPAEKDLSPEIYQTQPEKNEEKAIKVNAFQFMMASRFKSIGQNSPGKTPNEEESGDPGRAERREKLLSRREIFKRWADARGGLKRKEVEEEKDVLIKRQLEKRAKRMRKLLASDGGGDEETKEDPSPTKGRRVVVIDSDPEDCVAGKNEVEGDDAGSLSMMELTPKTLNKWRMRVRLLLKDEENASNSNAAASASSISGERTPGKEVKVAPIFLSKPKLTREALEARRKFLESGMPNPLKRPNNSEQKPSAQHIEPDFFPRISHVQQKPPEDRDRGENEIDYWNLPSPSVEFSEEPIGNYQISNPNQKLGLSVMLEESEDDRKSYLSAVDASSIKDYKKSLLAIKAENPNMAVIEIFKKFHERTAETSNGEKPEIAVKKKRGRKKKSPDSKKSQAAVENSSILHSTWVEKYKPLSSEEIVGNSKAIGELKKWLRFWIESGNGENRSKRNDSSLEFETSDEDSDSLGRSRLKTALILHGPCSSGKTSAVYAICEELRIKVLEVNASSKRTGKHLLQKLQESTQSHQVDKNGSKEFCLLLIEDVDVIFDQDDGFTSSLAQILSASKRPVVLTTSDRRSQHVQRFIGQYLCLNFKLPPIKESAGYLQIICLNEGLLLGKKSLRDLLGLNGGDMRKSLLQLQFWCQSGGQRQKFRGDGNELSVEVVEDEDLDLSWLKSGENVRLQEGCAFDFVAVKNALPYPLCLKFLHANIPNLLPVIPSEKTRRSAEDIGQKKPEDRGRLNALRNFYDSVALADVVYNKIGAHRDGELGNRNFKLLDGMGLNESDFNYTINKELSYEWTHFLMEASVRLCNDNKNADDSSFAALNFGDHENRRKMKKAVACDEVFSAAISPLYRTNRGAASADYLPYLRAISRSESRRNSHNGKRGGRFFNYLTGLGVRAKEAVVKTAQEAFSVKEEGRGETIVV